MITTLISKLRSQFLGVTAHVTNDDIRSSSLFTRAIEVPVFESQTDGNEDKVEEEHGEAKSPVHLPPEAGNTDDDKDQHGKEEDYTADHAFRVDLYGLAVDQPVEQPGQR